MKESVAHFRLLEKLGEGGMGVVYKALDLKLRRVVALKVLPVHISDDPDRRKRLLREARAAAAVTHPHLAAIYEAGESDDDVYIAMELVEGETLRRHAKANPLSVERALAIARPILQALARAHKHGVIHRDLKPDNVMITEDGLVKVLDFGIATVVEQPGDMTISHITNEARIVGTPGYMSPEQAAGHPIDLRTDLFAFGVLLCEILIGRLPFTGTTPIELIVSMARDPPMLPSATRDDIPRFVDRIIARCLAKDPKARYASCAEILAEIDRGDAPEAATIDSIGARAASGVDTGPTVTVQHPPARRGAIVVGAVLAVCIGIAITAMVRRSQPPTQPPTSAPVATSSASQPAVSASTSEPKPIPSVTATAPPATSTPSTASATAPKPPTLPKKPTPIASSSTVAKPGPLDEQK